VDCDSAYLGSIPSGHPKEILYALSVMAALQSPKL